MLSIQIFSLLPKPHLLADYNSTYGKEVLKPLILKFNVCAQTYVHNLMCNFKQHVKCSLWVLFCFTFSLLNDSYFHNTVSCLGFYFNGISYFLWPTLKFCRKFNLASRVYAPGTCDYLPLKLQFEK